MGRQGRAESRAPAGFGLRARGGPRAYLPEVGNRNKPNECCGATVAFDAWAFADARRRVADFFGYHLKAR